MKLTDFDLKELERTIWYLIEELGGEMTLQELYDKICDLKEDLNDRQEYYSIR